MAYIHPEATDTRAMMLASYRKGLQDLIEDATQRPGARLDDDGVVTMTLGDWDGVPVVTRKRLDEAVDAVFGLPVPAPDERRAEVSTPAMVWVSAVCPRCAIPQVILMTVHPELLVDDDGSELRVKAKAKGVSHTCGQLPLPVAEPGAPADGQGSFELEDIIGKPEQDGAAEPDPALAALEELLRPGETLDAALERLEADPDHLALMGSDAGQRLMSEINRGRGHAVLVPEPGSRIPFPLRDANDVDFGEGAPNAEDRAAFERELDGEERDREICPYPGCIANAEHPFGHDIPEASEDDDSDLLPA